MNASWKAIASVTAVVAIAMPGVISWASDCTGCQFTPVSATGTGAADGCIAQAQLDAGVSSNGSCTLTVPCRTNTKCTSDYIVTFSDDPAGGTCSDDTLGITLDWGVGGAGSTATIQVDDNMDGTYGATNILRLSCGEDMIMKLSINGNVVKTIQFNCNGCSPVVE